MIVLVDGRSGSGKTELANRIIARRPDWQLVRLDELYPGWDGLDAGSAAVPVLLETLRWRAWEWQRGVPAAWHELDPERSIVVEGAGAVSRASRPLADLAVWVELDGATRKRRALERDSYFAPFWDRWAAQEEEFIAREHPQDLVDLTVDGAHVDRACLELEP